MKSFAAVATLLGASLVAARPQDPITAHVLDLQKRQFGGGKSSSKSGSGKSTGAKSSGASGAGAMGGGMGGMGGLFGGYKVKDPPGAAPKRAELAVRVKTPGARTSKLRYGPYKVPNMKIKNFLGEEGALWNYPDRVAEKPCEKCTIVGINAGLEFPDGKNANIDNGLWLHHMVLFSIGPGRKDATCGYTPISMPHGIVGTSPLSSERLFSSGNERTQLIMPHWNQTDVGYKLRATDKFALIVDLMNETNDDKVVYLTITYDWIEGHPTNFDDIRPVWFDVAQCLTSEWPAPYETGKYTIPSTFWQPDFEGDILGTAGHLHDGGQHIRLEVNGKQVCDSKASYGGSPEFISKMAHGGGTTVHISNMSLCSGPTIGVKKVTKDQRWQLKADYDYENNKGSHHGDGKQSNVMGIAIMYVRVKSQQ